MCKQTAYEGFSPEITRNQFYQIFKDGSSTNFCRALILVFVAYCGVKNNIGKLGLKRMNLEWSKKLYDSMEEFGIKKKADSKETLTLPRLAISFMPELLAYRKYLGSELQHQTESSINVAYQDLAFCGCPSINGLPGYDIYHKEMSSYIYKPGEETALDDKKFLASLARWSKVSKTGYKKDFPLIERMNQVFPSSGWTTMAAYRFIEGAFNNKEYMNEE